MPRQPGQGSWEAARGRLQRPGRGLQGSFLVVRHTGPERVNLDIAGKVLTISRLGTASEFNGTHGDGGGSVAQRGKDDSEGDPGIKQSSGGSAVESLRLPLWKLFESVDIGMRPRTSEPNVLWLRLESVYDANDAWLLSPCDPECLEEWFDALHSACARGSALAASALSWKAQGTEWSWPYVVLTDTYMRVYHETYADPTGMHGISTSWLRMTLKAPAANILWCVEHGHRGLPRKLSSLAQSRPLAFGLGLAQWRSETACCFPVHKNAAVLVDAKNEETHRHWIGAMRTLGVLRSP